MVRPTDRLPRRRRYTLLFGVANRWTRTSTSAAANRPIYARVAPISAGSVQVQCRLKTYLHCSNCRPHKGFSAISAGSAGSVGVRVCAHARTHAQGGEYRENVHYLHWRRKTPTDTRLFISAGRPGTCTEPALNEVNLHWPRAVASRWTTGT